jgi:phage terminase small subunit
MALTGKKKLFADAVLAGNTNKASAISAGYSAATASPAGSRLVKDKEVISYLAKCRALAAKGIPPADDKPTFNLAEALQHSDPKIFLLAAMNDVALDGKLRIDAAKALMPFVHGKIGEGGKKEIKQDAAKQAGTGRFASSAPPKLVVNNRK